MRYSTSLHALAGCALLSTAINAHSWVERLTTISSDGSFTGEPGYARGNILRTDPKFAAGGDPLMVNQLPPLSQGVTITPQNNMCKDTQMQQIQTSGSPRLKAAAGSMIALQYQENGHVTLPENQPGKPGPSRGTVYIYGTTQPKSDEKFLNVHKVWNADGSGGDKRGKLLAAMPYDDGRCYQVNPSKISTTRQGQFKFPADKLMGNNLWCQNDLKLPSDAPDGKPYTLYWVWDWPTLPNVDPNIKNGKPEIYTTCMDIDISGQPKASSQGAYKAGIPASNAAIPSYFDQLVQGKNIMQMDAGSAPDAKSAAPSASTPPASMPSASMKPSGSPMPSAGPSPSVVTTTVHDTVYVTFGGPPSNTPAAKASSSMSSAPVIASPTPTLSTVSSALPNMSTPSAAPSTAASSNATPSTAALSTATLSTAIAPTASLPTATQASPTPSMVTLSRAPTSVAASSSDLPRYTIMVTHSTAPTAMVSSSAGPMPTASKIQQRGFGSVARARLSVRQARGVYENKGGENLIGGTSSS
ncbi:MAG: hypothetical protein M1814_001253 [Vezdaea aestivalis]|nr:MAG: hypothetical protein M1814_001253 [Vezdaea aestivalis]